MKCIDFLDFCKNGILSEILSVISVNLELIFSAHVNMDVFMGWDHAVQSTAAFHSVSWVFFYLTLRRLAINHNCFRIP